MSEIQEAVHAELARFFTHMQNTAYAGLHYDNWIREGLDWYINSEVPQ